MIVYDKFSSSAIDAARNTSPKSMLNKSKLQPFGAHFVTKLASVNSKLVCSLSARADCDVCTDYTGPCADSEQN